MHRDSIFRDGQQRQPYQDELLSRLLRSCFGDIDETAIALLRQHLEWVEIAGGQTLIEQGEPGDSMYLLVSGRLRAYVRNDDNGNGHGRSGASSTSPGGQRMLGEITRGQIVGEMSLYTDEPRMATVVAIRDSVLVKLGKEAFDRLLASSAQVSVALTRQIIQRLKQAHQNAPTVFVRPITIGLLPISPGIDLAELGAQLAAQLQRLGRVEVIDALRIDEELNAPEATLGPGAMVDLQRRMTLFLDRVEADADFVLLLGDALPTAWTERCCRDADELLLLADASQPPAIHSNEKACLLNRPARTEVAEVLVLLHAADAPVPVNTRAWLDRRPVADHWHIRPALERDLARLARLLSRTATGLVLAGGGARGLAHLGVYRALQEQGIEVDCVGGTSIGAVMATYVASDRPWAQVMANARRAFSTNPTGDWNPLPWLSLFRGRRLKQILEVAVRDLLGGDADVEDLWKTWFCVTTNYTHAREQVLRRGRLVKALLASTAIPGALPPVLHEGELLCDGGSFNNFPVDVMRAQRGIGRVIGIDLDFRQPLRVDLDDVPGGWALFVDSFRPLRQRRYRLPSLAAYLMTVMVLYSISRSRRSRALTDLYFNPPLDRVGLLQWHRFDRIVQRGYDHAINVLGEQAKAAAAMPRPPDANDLS
ncbi:patatin-like phospholipase family protein [Aquabacterium humicola]|uniref:patatin-like phospholipase family protein n=1 Tax=Aquabacterium humicola TaxID=3237377 RepID=UPI002543A076|nr:cyclic nucleotide-binding and patatin-like phospholipase domain-containing protein [Rubrivivax pictus]